MAWLSDPQIWASFLTLSVLEVVLGIDNIAFISITTNKLPEAERARGRRLGIGLAFLLRLLMLSGVAWIVSLTEPLFEAFGYAISWRDLILIAGGLFLLFKGTQEIHNEFETRDEGAPAVRESFFRVVAQIALLDIVFSVDSVITAVGMTSLYAVMVAAITVAVLVMLFAAGPVGSFIERHPTTKMLALSFLLLVGVVLVADGLHFHVPRGYLYFAIGFSGLVEVLNIVRSKRRRARIAQRAG